MKIDWWKIAESNSNKESVIIEYRLVDNKEFANQYKILIIQNWIFIKANIIL